MYVQFTSCVYGVPRSVSGWFGPKCKCKINSYLNDYFCSTIHLICLILLFYCKLCTFRFILFLIHCIFLKISVQEWINQIYIQTTLTFPVPKIGLSPPFQLNLFLFSEQNCRGWSWNVKIIFLSFEPFSKCTFLRL